MATQRTRKVTGGCQLGFLWGQSWNVALPPPLGLELRMTARGLHAIIVPGRSMDVHTVEVESRALKLDLATRARLAGRLIQSIDLERDLTTA